MNVASVLQTCQKYLVQHQQKLLKKKQWHLKSIFLYMPVLNTSQYHTFQPMSVSDWEGYTEPRKFLNLGSLSWKAWKMNPQGAITIPNYP